MSPSRAWRQQEGYLSTLTPRGTACARVLPEVLGVILGV